MKALKQKIFEVLTNKIGVCQFEEWLYNTEEITSQLDINRFYFNVITINYKSNDWTNELNNLVESEFDEDYLEITRIKDWCLNILKSSTVEEIRAVLEDVYTYYNFDTEYNICWEFYTLRDYFGLVEEGVLKIGILIEQAKYYSVQTLNIMSNYESFNDLKLALEERLITYDQEILEDDFLDTLTSKPHSNMSFFKKLKHCFNGLNLW